MTPKVSVIIPNYNHASFLGQRIESVLHQTFQDFEVILLDDCSTDDSQAILERYRHHPKVTHLVVNEQNSGSPFRQWNRGVGLAQGAYVWMAESDDYAAPTFLEKLVPLLDHRPSVGLVFCQSNNVDEAGTVKGNWKFHTDPLDPYRWDRDYLNKGAAEISDYMIFKPVIVNASAVLFRRRCYLEVGMAPEHFRLTGDYLLWIKILASHDVYYLAEELNYFRSHRQTTRSGYRQRENYRLWIGEIYQVLAWTFKHVPVAEENRRKICDHLATAWMSGYVLKTLWHRSFWRLYRHAAAVDPHIHAKVGNFVLLQIKYKLKHMLSSG